ncbi:hypothetical protein ACOMHN_065252 [Nucella lapillus]
MCTLVSSCGALSCNSSLQELYEDWDPSPYSCEGRFERPSPPSPVPVITTVACMTTATLTSSPNGLDQNSSRLMPESLSDSLPHSLGRSVPLVSSSTNGSPTFSAHSKSTSRCMGKASLIFVCPTPMSLPLGSVVYGGRKIEGGEVLEKCQTAWDLVSPPDFVQLLPVSDSVTGHHFLNIYCFLCHGGHVSQAVPWSVSFMWMGLANVVSDTPHTVQQLLERVREEGVPVVAVPPPNVTARRCGLPSAQLQSSPCPCPDLLDSCTHSSESFIEANYQLYRHSSCLCCVFIGVDRRPRVIRVPDLHQWTWGSRNAVFRVNLTWSSHPANSPNASLAANYHPRVGRSPGKACHVESCMTSSTTQAHCRGTLPRDRPITGGDQGITEETFTPTNEKSEGEDRSASSSIDPTVRCEQTECARDSMLMDSVCHADLQSLYLHVHMTCVDSETSDPHCRWSWAPRRSW